MTRVCFRIDKQKDENGYREVTAVFVDEIGTSDPFTRSCYAHIGQHSVCSIAWIMQTAPAKPEEYTPLLAELKAIGYDDLKVLQRFTRKAQP